MDSENFLKLFKIHNSDRRILKATADEVGIFKGYKKAFDNTKPTLKDRKEIQDLYFEFQVILEN